MYYCQKCKTSVETSECPVCGSRTISMTKVYWDKNLNIPIILNELDTNSESLKLISSDIRPVHPEERLLLEILINKPLEFINSSCWSSTGGTYYIDGKKVRLTISQLMTLDDNEVRKKYNHYKVLNNDIAYRKYTDLFVENNRDRYELLVNEAMEYIKRISEKYDFDSRFVSFSGGKDSTVVSDLVIRALGTPKVLHIFGDTTLEFPETYEYVKRFRQSHRLTPMIDSKNREKNFFDLAETLGPPSRVMRWCCTVFKTGAITRDINSIFKNKTRILTYYGIRRSESASRSKYERDSDSPKITKQRTVSPIIDWIDADVWLYILSRKIDYNDAYKYGFTRVGCWCCPNNSGWSEFLSKIHHPEQFYKFRDLLIRNAIAIGKPDPDEYVDSGSWKAKQGGEGIEYSKKTAIKWEPCATEDNAFNYELQKPIDNNLYELFKPFGTLNFDLGNKRLGEVFVLDNTKRIILKIQGKIGQKQLKVTIVNFPVSGAKNLRDAERKIECQITKFQTCLNCSACMSVCRFGAIKIKYDDGVLDYRVDENKCVHCFECINHFTSGCYLKKVLRTKK